MAAATQTNDAKTQTPPQEWVVVTNGPDAIEKAKEAAQLFIDMQKPYDPQRRTPAYMQEQAAINAFKQGKRDLVAAIKVDNQNFAQSYPQVDPVKKSKIFDMRADIMIADALKEMGSNITYPPQKPVGVTP